MQNVDQTWEEIASGLHWKEVKADISDGHGGAAVTYGMDTISALSTRRAAFGTGTPQIGIAAAGSMKLTMRGVSAESIPRMAEVDLHVRVCNSTQQSGWIPKGVYFIDTRQEGDGRYLQLTGYDAMLKAEQWLDMTNITWPMIDIDLVELIVERTLFPNENNDPNYNVSDHIDSRTYALMTQAFTIPVPEPTEYTCREMLANIAGLYGGSFIINDMNKLQLICIWDKPIETNYLLIDPDGTGRVLIGGDKIILTANPNP